MRSFPLAAIMAAISIAGAAPASAGPADEVCAFAASIAEGTDAGIAQLLTMAEPWPPSDRAKLEPIFRAEMDKFDMIAGEVWTIADLGDLATEYLIVSADRNGAGNLYFRILYEASPDGMFFKNAKFNSDYYAILANGFLDRPRKLVCG